MTESEEILIAVIHTFEQWETVIPTVEEELRQAIAARFRSWAGYEAYPDDGELLNAISEHLPVRAPLEAHRHDCPYFVPGSHPRCQLGGVKAKCQAILNGLRPNFETCSAAQAIRMSRRMA